MNVYDFDGTLYRGDSTFDFLKWCLRRYPRVAASLPRMGLAAALFGVGAIDKTRFKGSLYRFLRHVPDVNREVERFWAMHERQLSGPCAPRAGDVVISGSPEFLLRGVCDRRGLELIASQVDPHTGRVLGPNCSEGEKVRRFHEQFGDAAIERFYSDSRNDDPLAALADEAYLVDASKGTLKPWPVGQKSP